MAEGFELGSLRSDGELAARLGRASAMRVLLPEYRLGPEHPFPAAIDDVLAAWRWLRTDQDLSARSIAVAGDSAGGGLAVALLVALRDAGEALPAAACRSVAAPGPAERADCWRGGGLFCDSLAADRGES
jgi:monoterpene epsilon-lactone hydrolase